MVLLAFAGGYALGVGSVLAAAYFAARWAMRRAVDPSRR
jgi:hypothetical protein